MAPHSPEKDRFSTKKLSPEALCIVSWQLGLDHDSLHCSYPEPTQNEREWVIEVDDCVGATPNEIFQLIVIAIHDPRFATGGNVSEVSELCQAALSPVWPLEKSVQLNVWQIESLGQLAGKVSLPATAGSADIDALSNLIRTHDGPILETIAAVRLR